jgi:endonuclease YncB( thermonuclease family)
LCKLNILKWVETCVYETMATPNTDPLASQSVTSAATAKTATSPGEETPTAVTVRVLTDTPVNRVRKGATLSLEPEIADQFVKLNLVEIVKTPA